MPQPFSVTQWTHAMPGGFFNSADSIVNSLQQAVQGPQSRSGTKCRLLMLSGLVMAGGYSRLARDSLQARTGFASGSRRSLLSRVHWTRSRASRAVAYGSKLCRIGGRGLMGMRVEIGEFGLLVARCQRPSAAITTSP